MCDSPTAVYLGVRVGMLGCAGRYPMSSQLVNHCHGMNCFQLLAYQRKKKCAEFDKDKLRRERVWLYVW